MFKRLHEQSLFSPHRHFQALAGFAVFLASVLFFFGLTLAPALADHSPTNGSLNLIVGPSKTINLDLRSYWRTTKIGDASSSPRDSLDPDTVWQWPEDKFKAHVLDEVQQSNAKLRTISRLRLLVTGEPAELVFSATAARLDAVNFSYRYDSGPWIRAQAGDKVPMLSWPSRSFQPVLPLLAREATIDIVVEVAHRGVWNAEFLLQDLETANNQRLDFLLLIGMLIGLNAVLALVAIVSARTFMRWGFWAVAVMAIAIAVQTASNSGIAGMYIAKDSDFFNDEAKFLTSLIWCAILPWVCAVVIGLRFQERWFWRISVACAVIGVSGSFIAADYASRDSISFLVPIFFLVYCGTSISMAIYGVRRQNPYAWRSLLGVLLYVAALTILVSVYTGQVSSQTSALLVSLLSMLAALVFLNVLTLQHRQGRMVMSRASATSGRDMLTGLLNAQGFSRALERSIARLSADNGHAVMFYVALDGSGSLRERYGDEGFEVGLVQIASMISSVVSANDAVGRVGESAFAVCVDMPREPELASRFATKLLTRVMSLTSHSAPLAGTARVAIAWVPTFGKTLPELQRRSVRVLDKLTGAKRIAWVGGAYAQLHMNQSPLSTSAISSQPKSDLEAGRDDPLPSVPGITAPGPLPNTAAPWAQTQQGS